MSCRKLDISETLGPNLTLVLVKTFYAHLVCVSLGPKLQFAHPWLVSTYVHILSGHLSVLPRDGTFVFVLESTLGLRRKVPKLVKYQKFLRPPWVTN